MKKNIKGNVSWVGHIDWELEWFHGQDYSIKNGTSHNAYLIEEEKTVLVDTVWTPHRFEFVENLKGDRPQQDRLHRRQPRGMRSPGALPAVMEKIPETPIYCTSNAVKSIEGNTASAAGTSTW